MNNSEPNAVVHTHADGTPVDWSKILTRIVNPLRPDAYHRLNGSGKLETIEVRYKQMDSVPDADDERWAVFEAWCLFTQYHWKEDRDTLMFSVAGRLAKYARSEDKFQQGMMAILEELDSWRIKYPAGEDRGRLHPDDVPNYLTTVGLNAMRRRKRKPVEFGDDLVENAEADIEEDAIGNETLKFIDDTFKEPLDQQLLRLKRERLTEADMARMLGLSRDQVQRKISRMYKKVCARTQLEATPMGRSPRRSREDGDL